MQKEGIIFGKAFRVTKNRVLLRISDTIVAHYFTLGCFVLSKISF